MRSHNWRPSRRPGGLPPLGSEEGTHRVDSPCGAFFLIEGDLARQLGGMDEAFFLYFEETDLAKRARDEGFECL